MVTSTPLTPSFFVGNTPVYSPILLAPMAGVTDVVFRHLVREWSPDSLVCTEMISSNGLVHSRRNRKPHKVYPNHTKDQYILARTDEDHPIAYQLAAHQADILLEAAEAILTEHNPISIDLNMGCPVKKITGNFEGCALMKEPAQAASLVKTLTDRLPVPVTVKFRLGWDNNSMNYLDFGKRLEDAGAKMVTLHARTRSQGYAPGCKWEAFGELKQTLSIPVIANGDITTAAEAQHILTTYGVDGVMVGRAALGNPWLIGQMHTALMDKAPMRDLPLETRFAVALDHAQRYVAARGLEETLAMRDMRKHLAWYATNFHGASDCRRQLTQVNTVAEVEAIFAQALQHNSRSHDLPVAC
jgi:tRNA-dihydrouridine synthase B